MTAGKGREHLNEPSSSIPVFLVSLVIQFAALETLYSTMNIDAYDKFFQSFFVVLVSMVISFLLLVENKTVGYVLVFLQFLADLFVCKAIGIEGDIYLYQSIVVVLQISSFLTIPFAAAGSFFIWLSTSNALQVHFTNSKVIDGISSKQRLLTFLIYCASAILGMALHYYYQLYKKQRDENSRLEKFANKIMNTNLAYQNYAVTLEKNTIKNERQRISREIHDIIGYTMTNILMLIQAALNSRDEEQRDMLLKKASAHLNDSVDRARLSLRRMREQDIPEEHGRNLFRRLTTTFAEVTDCTIVMDYGNLPESIDSEIEKILLSTIEEGLTNSFKHGKADSINISLWYEKGWISLRITDNGLGKNHKGDEVKAGIGIQGMREQIIPLGGMFSARYVPEGFRIQAALPMEVTEDE
ncbi:MAG: histidine kinase [Treponema sp.]|jgi:signal transduction histidine kinase|nr:histidine kinase [Treponema sp.]